MIDVMNPDKTFKSKYISSNKSIFKMSVCYERWPLEKLHIISLFYTRKEDFRALLARFDSNSI